MAGFDSTLGGATANSYCSLVEADDFFQFNVYATQWNAFDEDAKRAALVQATFFLETISYEGTRCNPATDDNTVPQALSWPRAGAVCDGIESTCAAIPKEIIQAQCLLALNLATTPDSITGPIGGGDSSAPPGTFVSQQTLGDLSQSFTEYSNQRGLQLTAVRRM